MAETLEASAPEAPVSALDAKAREVSATLRHLHGIPVGSDSPFLDFLKELMTQLLPLLVTCIPLAQRNAAGVAKSLNSPNLRQRAGLRWTLAKNIDDPRTYNLSTGEIASAFYKMGAGVTEPQAALMMAEAA